MDDPSISGKVCIVTGGTRGLGRAMALALVDAGAKVLAPGHIPGDIPIVEKEVQKIRRNTGGEIHAMLADLRTSADCDNIVQTALDRYGKLEVLINNAGLGMRPFSENFMTDPVKFWETDKDQVQATLDTNVMGAFLMAKAAIPPMLKIGWGRIINVTTSIGTMQRRGFFPYGPSKAALEAATQVWSEDLAGTGVTANVLIPGRAANTDIMPTDWRKNGLHRSGSDPAPPEIMAPPALWLASNASDGFNGLRFEADKWDTEIDPTDAARKNSRPVGFELHEPA
ncbi:MAG: SDR family oxidoreductase [Rhodospirillaceae bacterium]|jgi:NAD(P)-dependent dehydrogenase (short-subunit alcohol dehydrogenase family)